MNDQKKDSLEVENAKTAKLLDISYLRYLWQSNPLFGDRESSIPKFLRQSKVLENFTENDLKIFCKYLHQRNYAPGEVVFKQDDVGLGFYFIFSGNMEILVGPAAAPLAELTLVTMLEKNDHFGEMALIENQHLRAATAVAKGQTVLLGFYRPDLDIMLDEDPGVAAKLLHSIGYILGQRMLSVTAELKRLKQELDKVKNV